MQLNVPPLRERREDIALLVDHFLAAFFNKFSKTVRMASHEVLTRFLEYPWPGNVRELEHALERACLLSRGEEIVLKDLPLEIREYEGRNGMKPAGDLNERERLLRILTQTGWNKAKAASLLGVSRPTLYRKMAETGLSRSS